MFLQKNDLYQLTVIEPVTLIKSNNDYQLLDLSTH